MCDAAASAAIVATMLTCAATRATAADTQHDQLIRADTDGDERLDRSELTVYFLLHDATIAELRKKGMGAAALQTEADLRADDALSYKCAACTSIPIDDALQFVRDRTRVTTPRKLRIGWKGLSFRRFATDPADPRQLKPDKRPALFSYKRDNEAADKDQVNWLGGVQLYKHVLGVGSSQVPQHFVSFVPAIEADIDGSKAANESSLEGGLPITYEWERPKGHTRIISGVSVAVTPKYLTDRSFERDGWEVANELSFSSTRLLRAGYNTAFGDGAAGAKLLVYWKPSFRLETGKITDANGNAKLEVLKNDGVYTRKVPRATISVRSERYVPALTVGVDYFYRIDATTQNDYGYGELRFTYDLTSDRSLSIGLVITNGRKPPEFAKTDRILVGFGFLQ